MAKVTEELLDQYAQYMGAVLTLKLDEWEKDLRTHPNMPPIVAARRTLADFNRQFHEFEKEGP